MQCRSTKPIKLTTSPDEISQAASKAPTELGLSNSSLLDNHNNPVHYNTKRRKRLFFRR
ncbi:dehydrogenase [Streptococcus sanguinis]|uniref:Dehydrogenase n=1 Tax=Streptococcus sanguinis TaxID=1305 RepID=A0A7H8V2R2_STRSA|nr:dehydrogenase [Streptococcus sanguinis]QLB52665.1 dehydrogenase [Streptococcus sanguinis]